VELRTRGRQNAVFTPWEMGNVQVSDYSDGYYSDFSPSVSYALGTAAWGWHAETGLHVLRMIAARVFDRLPDLQVIIGHMGAPVAGAGGESQPVGELGDRQAPVGFYLGKDFSAYR
jgi:hypothetical protein